MSVVGPGEVVQQLERVPTHGPVRDLQRLLQDEEVELLRGQQPVLLPDPGLPRLHLRVVEPARVVERVAGVLARHLRVVDDAEVVQPEQLVVRLEQEYRGVARLPETLEQALEVEHA